MLAASAAALARLAAVARAEAARLRERLRHEIDAGSARLGGARGERADATAERDAVADACGVALVLLGPDLVVTSANPLAEALLPAGQAGLVGHSLLLSTLSDELGALAREALDSGEPRDAEVRLPGPSGRLLAISARPLPASGAGPARLALVARDWTDRRHMERVRRDFVANVSHELRTPLASIRATAETLRDGAVDDPAVSQRFLDTIVTETERLARISANLLVLADAESRAREPADVDLTRLLGQTVERFRGPAAKAGVALTCEATGSLVAHAHAEQLEQAFANLVDNAITYTPAGGSVRVSGEAGPDGPVVRVADTGIGMMRDQLPRIFERFYRVDRARSRKSGGTGLGLAIVKHIVESHGGAVSVESELGRGSTFTLCLPAAHGPAAARQPDAPDTRPR